MFDWWFEVLLLIEVNTIHITIKKIIRRYYTDHFGFSKQLETINEKFYHMPLDLTRGPQSQLTRQSQFCSSEIPTNRVLLIHISVH